MGGFSTISGLETIMNADNASFDGTARGGAMTADGQLWIGSTTAPHVRLGILTSPGGTLTIGHSGSNITLDIAGGSAAIEKIQTDSGLVAPSGGVVTLNANTNSGKTVLFTGSGSTVSLKVTDTSRNTIIGLNSGTNNMGTDNVGLGEVSLASLNLTAGNASGNTCVGRASGNKITTGQSNTCIGQQSGNGPTTGTGNTFVGSATGTNYTSSESSNILIGANVSGTLGESNVCRIGTSGAGTGQITSCFIAGVQGVSVSNLNYVTINTSTGQLGSVAATTINVQTFTGNGTYTPTANMKYCIIECVGGGGGGGGAAASGAGTQSTAGGGASGGYSRKISTAATIGGSQTVTIGTAGAGGTAGNHNGTGGGQTSVGVICTANGGGGGNGTADSNSALGGTPGAAGTGDVALLGNYGGSGSGGGVITTLALCSGAGGNSMFGPGGLGQQTQAVGGGSNGNAAPAGAYGGGGGGGVSYAGSGAAAGGNGMTGYVVITEFINL